MNPFSSLGGKKTFNEFILDFFQGRPATISTTILLPYHFRAIDRYVYVVANTTPDSLSADTLALVLKKINENLPGSTPAAGEDLDSQTKEFRRLYPGDAELSSETFTKRKNDILLHLLFHEIRFSDFQTHLRSRSQELSIHHDKLKLSSTREGSTISSDVPPCRRWSCHVIPTWHGHDGILAQRVGVASTLTVCADVAGRHGMGRTVLHGAVQNVHVFHAGIVMLTGMPHLHAVLACHVHAMSV